MNFLKRGLKGGKNMYLIDSSIFLELVFDQERAPECKVFMQKVKVGEVKCFVSDFNIDSVLLAIYRHTKNINLMRTFFAAMIDLVNLSIYFIGIDDRIKAIGHIEKYGLDFEDSMTLQVAIGSSCTGIVSFDGHLDKLPIKRVEPKYIIKELE